MRVLGFKRFPLASFLALFALLPSGVEGQLRTVISNEIAVSENEATLRLDFQDQGELTISFKAGQILVDGESVGSYGRRDGLDLAWRSLLGEVVTLDDGPLAAALNDWDPPQGLTGEGRDLAARLDETLETALALPMAPEDPGAQSEVTVGLGGEGSLLAALLSRTGALNGLAEAMQGTPIDRFTLKIGEDVVVAAGEELEGTLIVVDGSLDVRGRIDGDVVLTGGTVRLLEGGIVTGDVRIADGALERSGGTVEGSFLDLDSEDEVQLERAELENLRRENENLRSHRERVRPRPTNVLFGLFGNVASAIAGLLENLVTFLVLAVLGVLAVHFQRERLEVVATTARRAPMRSAVVGLAGGFFILPVWIVGAIALAITIIGIPVLLAWVPLFPIAAGVAILLGFLAVARNVGEWVAEQEYRGLEWIRGSNTFYTVIAGVGALMLPCVASSAFRILGFGFLTGLMSFVASMVAFAAAAVGFGAVLLTRGGKIRPLESYYDFEEDYWADIEPRQPREPPPEPATEQPTEPDEGSGEAVEAGEAEGPVDRAGDGEGEGPRGDTRDSDEEKDEHA